tara:strand:+ start:104 stop:442 length:339 start_codon:yes stop_codon:yes gene_type:complete
MRKILVFLFILLIYGCASTQPSLTFVKVLGVTSAGDTILIDVNSLRPRVYNNYYYRNGYNQHPYNYYNTIPVVIRPYKPKPNRPVIITPIGTRPTINNNTVSVPFVKPIKDN